MRELALTPQLDGEVQNGLAEESGWVERARQGEMAAFDAIVTHYEQRLLRFLIGLVGDVEVARELCQDTFLAAYRSLPATRGQLKLSAWLHTIALNKARSHHRRRRFRIPVPFGDEEMEGAGGDMQETVATRDLVQRTLQRLPRQHAEVLLLQIASDLSCREIAQLMSCSEGAVKVRLLRAREAFRRAYEQEVNKPCTT